MHRFFAEMCLVAGCVQFGCVAAVEKETARHQAAQPDPERRTATEQKERGCDARLRETAAIDRASNTHTPAGCHPTEEISPKVAERRVRPVARLKAQRHVDKAKPGRSELGPRLRQRLRLL